MQKNRRNFISTAFKASAAVALLPVSTDSYTEGYAAAEKLVFPPQDEPHGKAYTVQQIIDLIKAAVPGKPIENTVDTLKSGHPQRRVTGVVTTMFPTIPIILETIRLKANFIIAHEPTFYNHTDDTAWAGDNEIVKRKQALLKENDIAIWRCHDYWHAIKPDGILHGLLEKTGWQRYARPGEILVNMPPASLRDIAGHLKSSLQIEHLRVIGDLARPCQKLAILPGAWGGQRQLSTIEKEQPDVLIVGEVHEWETAEYVRDARAMGKNIALVVLGHAQSEEPGMEWMAQWLQPRLEDIPVTHIPSGNPFQWV